jgi:hypothetical protein
MAKFLVAMAVATMPPQAPSVPQDTLLFVHPEVVTEQVVFPFTPVILPPPVLTQPVFVSPTVYPIRQSLAPCSARFALPSYQGFR